MRGWFVRSIWEAGARALVASLMLGGPTLGLADPVHEKLQNCGASSTSHARSLGDLLLNQGAYQQAGKCYEAAGDYDLANKAYIKAVGPQSKATAGDLEKQVDQAKALLRKVQQGFHT